jgi:cytochrome c
MRVKDLKSILIAMVVGLFAASNAALAQQALLAGRPDVGATVFKQCMACHQVGISARNGIGPVLNGVIGRRAGSYPGYGYSSANKNSVLVWDYQTLASYLRAPAEVVPGTKMIFFGLRKSQDVADVIAYLQQFDGNGKQTGENALMDGTARLE